MGLPDSAQRSAKVDEGGNPGHLGRLHDVRQLERLREESDCVVIAVARAREYMGSMRRGEMTHSSFMNAMTPRSLYKSGSESHMWCAARRASSASFRFERIMCSIPTNISGR